MARAIVRPASSIRTSFFSPTNSDAVDDVDQVAVDLGDRVVVVVHVRLDEVDVHLLAGPERHRVLLDLRARALHGHREVVQRQAVGALEVEVAAGLLLERVQLARAVGDEPGRDLRVDPQQVRLGAGVAGLDDHVAQVTGELDRDRLLGLHDALAASTPGTAWS